MAEIPKNSFQGPLAPKIGLNDTMRNPIPGGSKMPPPKRDYSHFIPVAAFAIALLILPLTIQQLSQQQDVRQRASQPTPTIPLPTPITNSTPTITGGPAPTSSQGANLESE